MGRSEGKERTVRPMRGAERAAWLHDDAIAALELAEGLCFSEAEYARRHRVALAAASNVGADAYLVFRPSTVDWLTGFHSGTVQPMPALVWAEGTAVVLPSVEAGRAIAGSCADEIMYHGPTQEPVAVLGPELARRLGGGATVALDESCQYLPRSAAETLRAAGLNPVDGAQGIDFERMTLSSEEVAAVERAAGRTARGARAAAQAASQPGATDSSIAAAILSAVVPKSDSLVRGEVFVATGWRGGVTHSTFNNTQIQANTTTFLEFAGTEHHYPAPVMRTLLHGTATREIRRLEELARVALEATLEHLRPGSAAADIARSVTRELGTLEDDIVFHFTYGYSLTLAHGTSWLDAPAFLIREDNPAPLREGMLLHLPAVMRAFGKAAVGCSHTVLVEDRGPRIITDVVGPAELIRLPPPATLSRE